MPRPPRDELGTPVMYFLIADQLLIFDRVAQTITVLVNAVLDDAASPAEAYENAVAEIDRLVALLEQPSEHRPVSVPDPVPSVAFESNVPREQFFANVLKAKEYITWRATSSRWSAPSGSPRPSRPRRSIFTAPPARSTLAVHVPARTRTASRSWARRPEIHVRCEERQDRDPPDSGHAAPRQRRPEEDAGLEKELLADPKERAEHVMLVDLARNDLGRVCDFGSVRVKDLMIIERYSHVMHIVSQVEGRFRRIGPPMT